MDADFHQIAPGKSESHVEQLAADGSAGEAALAVAKLDADVSASDNATADSFAFIAVSLSSASDELVGRWQRQSLAAAYREGASSRGRPPTCIGTARMGVSAAAALAARKLRSEDRTAGLRKRTSHVNAQATSRQRNADPAANDVLHGRSPVRECAMATPTRDKPCSSSGLLNFFSKAKLAAAWPFWALVGRAEGVSRRALGKRFAVDRSQTGEGRTAGLHEMRGGSVASVYAASAS